MPKYFTDFSRTVIGQPPVGWTSRLNTSSVWTVQEMAGATNDRGLVMSKPTSGRTMLARNEIDADSSRENCEVLLRARFPTGSGEIYGFGRAAGTTDANTDGYRMGETSTPLTSSSVLAKYQAGVFTSFSTTGRVTVGTSWFRVRARINGSTIFRKVWLDANEEPAGWTSQHTDSSPLNAAGWVGLFAFEAGLVHVDWVGFGTGGDTAPNPRPRRPLLLLL